VHGRHLWQFAVSFSISSILLVCPAEVAHADPAPPASTSASVDTVRGDQAVYVELLGKGGLYGLGYDYQFHPRFAVGATASYYVLDGQEIFDLSPYLMSYLVGTHRQRWFLQLGPQLSYVRTPSPVPEWPGESRTGIGGELCSGWEYRHGVLVRVFGMLTIGEGGAAPWMGVSLGWAL
jgi:hypothetical protein